MDLMACVDIAAFPLQLLYRRQPSWREQAAAVVAEDKPQGLITCVNEHARAQGVLPGQRFAQALSLAPTLRASTVGAAEIAAGVADLHERLLRFSPAVEPYTEEAGVFWLDGTGLMRLFGSLEAWADAILHELQSAGFVASLAIGPTRFTTYALARARARAVTVMADAAQAHAAARKVDLARLGIAANLREQLRRLGVVTVGQLAQLPAGGMMRRFGAHAYRLHQLAAGTSWDPLRAQDTRQRFENQVHFDDPERNTDRLVFACKSALDPMLARLARAGRALSALEWAMVLDHGTSIEEEPAHRPVEYRDIRPAEPTLDARLLLRLLHLRLESAPPPAGVREIRLRAVDVAATREQLELFRHRPKRDLAAANQALASLRAVLGERAVLKATVREGHLPEARYGFETLAKVVKATPRPADARYMIRRIHRRARMLPPQEHRYRDDGWLLGSVEAGPVTKVVGPYVLSGGWWHKEVFREYHYAETRRGDVLWVYYDRRRRRWFEHGWLE